MSGYLLLKTVHILSSTVLFGTGIGTAFAMWMAHLSGNPRTVADVARNVVLADWIFTVPAGFLQPATGIGLVLLQGRSPFESWLIVTYALYVLAGLCWVRVAWLQIFARRMAETAAKAGLELPSLYYRTMREWFVLGWPAFISLIVIYGMMVFKPDLF